LTHLISTPLVLLAAALLSAPANAAPVVVYAAGDIAECRGKPAAHSGAALTAKLVQPGAMVLIPGDTAYPFATSETLQSCYEPTWGAFRATTLVVPGNHDYVDGRSDDFRAYFGGGAAANGYFARRVGDWLVIGLDSEQVGGSLERQYAWLQATLRETSGVRCTLAFWHRPAFSSGIEHGSSEKMQRFWALLEGHGAEFVLNGHEHFYEAFGPLDGTGRDAADGMREFVVGTGGARLYPIWNPVHQSRVRHARHGVLKLTLDAGSYSWQFIDTRGRVLDAGEASCRQ
jgi:3',5'-cyclic AMP phosphodiesterase CpdA